MKLKLVECPSSFWPVSISAEVRKRETRFNSVTVITRVSWVVDGLVRLDEDVTRQKGHFIDMLNLLEVSKLGD